MNTHKKLVATTFSAALLTTVGTASASAATFNFSYFDTNVTASGVLTTAPYSQSTNSYQITGITGTRNGVTIDLLLPPDTIAGNDNLLLASSPQLDASGFSYSAGGINYNAYYFASTGYYEYRNANNTTLSLASFSATPTTVPEPSPVLGTLGVGVLMGGILLQRLKQKNSSSSS